MAWQKVWVYDFQSDAQWKCEAWTEDGREETSKQWNTIRGLMDYVRMRKCRTALRLFLYQATGVKQLHPLANDDFSVGLNSSFYTGRH